MKPSYFAAVDAADATALTASADSNLADDAPFVANSFDLDSADESNALDSVVLALYACLKNLSDSTPIHYRRLITCRLVRFSDRTA